MPTGSASTPHLAAGVRYKVRVRHVDGKGNSRVLDRGVSKHKREAVDQAKREKHGVIFGRVEVVDLAGREEKVVACWERLHGQVPLIWRRLL